MARYQISVAFAVLFLLGEIAQICMSVNSSISLPCIQRERDVLLKFKASLHDPSNRLSSWEGNDCCQWEGIGCHNVTAHVIKLNLISPCLRLQKQDESLLCPDDEPSLNAPNVDPSLLELEYLSYLDLSGNDFHGSPIPVFIGSMWRLTYLSLSHAKFVGRIPSSLRNLTNLIHLDLSDNYEYDNDDIQRLNSSDINWISRLQSLEHLDLSYVDLGGVHNLLQVLSILPSLLRRIHLSYCDLSNLVVPLANLSNNAPQLQLLDLSSNQLTNPLLDAFQNMTSLIHLDLSYNNLSSVPSWLPTFRKLKYLDIKANHGPILDVLRNLTSIEFLDLSQNSLTSVPCWFGELKKLVHLDLSEDVHTHMGCSLTSILTNLCRLRFLGFSSNKLRIEQIGDPKLSGCITYDLKELDLSYNEFRGHLPTWFGRLENLEYLNLGSNFFYGLITFSLGKLSNLKKLNLHNNTFDEKLDGFVPDSLADLQWLDLSSNYLNGIIPQSIGELVKLQELDLSNNYLNSTIPQNIGELINLQWLDLSNNHLNGTIPRSIGELVNLQELDLSNNHLSDTIPQSIGELVNLQELYLSNNHLSGTIPQSIGELVNLQELYLSNNHLNGTIPQSLSQLTNMKYIYLSENKIHGNIPYDFDQLVELRNLDLSSNKMDEINFDEKKWSSLMPKLMFLNLSYNHINSSLPQNIGNIMLNLEHLLLGSNQINGSIPNSLCQTELYSLDLSKNKLSGEIPDCWRDSPFLGEINFSSNKLAGFFPSSFWNISSLVWLHVNNNKLQGQLPMSKNDLKQLLILDLGENQLTGSIPSWSRKIFPSIQILRLRQNKLSGSIPSQLCQLSSLKILDLSRNSLEGSVPWCIGNLTGMTIEKSNIESTSRWYPFSSGANESLIDAWTKEDVKQVIKGTEYDYIKILNLVVNMDLSENKLVGAIPDGVTLLTGLHGLNLSFNHLEGEIPKMIGDMKSLESFDVSHNQLSGSIPNSMPSLTSLSHFNVSHNNFSGPIPIGNQFSTYDSSAYADNPYLCGHELPNKCPGDDSDELPGSNGYEDEDEKKDKLEKLLLYSVVAVGFATGFWGVIGVLMLKKSWRHACFRWVEDAADDIYVVVVIKVANIKKWLVRNRVDC